jgi:hypothetical protein
MLLCAGGWGALVFGDIADTFQRKLATAGTGILVIISASHGLTGAAADTSAGVATTAGHGAHGLLRAG